MNRRLNHLLAIVLQQGIWRGELLGAENLPVEGPAVFVCNHLKALGPIAAAASIPCCLHYWIHADMLDPARAGEYLRRDFVEPQLRLPGTISGHVAAALSRVTVPMLAAAGGIPVYQEPQQLPETYRFSVELLAQGEQIIIFPEDPTRPVDERTQMSAFKKGFARLGELYYRRTHRRLAFHPVAVHAGSRTVRLQQPLRFNPLNDLVSERKRIKGTLERTIQGMYLKAEADGERAWLQGENRTVL